MSNLVITSNADLPNKVPQNIPYLMGHVYAIESDSGLVKIGCTKNLFRRIRSIQTQAGFISKNICFTEPCYNFKEIEKLGHKRFGKYRQTGEWFNASFTDICSYLKECPIDQISRANEPSPEEAAKEFFEKLYYIEIHCQHCMCPKEIWEPSLKTYKPEDETKECEFFSDVLGVIWEFDDTKKPFSFSDILSKCKQDLELKYSDACDFPATVKEIVSIYLEEGVMPLQFSDITYLDKLALTGTDNK